MHTTNEPLAWVADEDTKLAAMILDWQRLKAQLDALERDITMRVLEKRETVVVGNTRASYYKESTTPDYEAAARAAHVTMDIISEYTEVKIVEKVDWKGLCEDPRTAVDMDNLPVANVKPAKVLLRAA